MDTELRKKAKNDFEKEFFKLMNNAVFGKPMENARKHRDIKLVTTDKKRNQLVSEQKRNQLVLELNYHTTKWFSENLLEIEMRNTKVKMNKSIYLGMAILDISKRLPIALAQISAGNNSESLSNEIRQIVYYLYRSKEITKNVYNNILKSIKV